MKLTGTRLRGPGLNGRLGRLKGAPCAQIDEEKNSDTDVRPIPKPSTQAIKVEQINEDKGSVNREKAEHEPPGEVRSNCPQLGLAVWAVGNDGI